MFKENWIRNILKCSLFVIIFFLILHKLSNLFLPNWKYMDDPEDWDGQTDQFTTFYNLPPNSIDVLLLGPSTTMYSFYPIELYDTNGIVSYSLASPRQQVAASYYWLMEAAKTQSLQCVVIDITQLLRDTAVTQIHYEATTWKSLGYMEFSCNKLKAILACKSPSTSALEYIFPIFRFHTRWNDLKEKDFQASTSNYPLYTKGSQISTIIAPYQGFQRYHAPAVIEMTEAYKNLYPYQEQDDLDVLNQQSIRIDPDAEKYFKLIQNYCNRNNIKLVCVKAPQITEWNQEMTTVLEQFSSDNGFEVIDMSAGKHYVNINWDIDTLDHGNHLNYFGAKKASEYLSNILHSLDIPNRKGDPMYASWDDALKNYKEDISLELMDFLPDKEKALSYFNTLNNQLDNSVIIFSVKDDISNGWNESFSSKFKELGLQANLYNKSQCSYIAVIDSGNILYENIAFTPLIFRDAFFDMDNTAHKLEVSSQGMISGNSCSIKIDDTEYSCQTKGLNIVVYDKLKAQITSSISIDFFLNGLMTEKDIVN